MTLLRIAKTAQSYRTNLLHEYWIGTFFPVYSFITLRFDQICMSMCILLLSLCEPKANTQASGPILLKCSQTCNLGLNRWTQTYFEKCPTSTRFGQKCQFFPKCVVFILFENRLVCRSGSLVSILGLKVRTTTLQWAFLHKNVTNRFRDWGWGAFDWKEIFLTPFLLIAAHSKSLD